ncbi:MAG: putative lysine decarboxylase [Methanoregula sp. PtaU1.Bin051]|nr:MAG: putative lysine decarboxylase [Methanoregula sp. PtaU1.Bin051]
MQIAVIGAGACTEHEQSAAYIIGRILAENHATLICGGLGGVMEAACRGAREHGGHTVGIMPDERDGNPYLDTVIRTDMGHARNIIVIQSADAVIAVGGKAGTLSEIAIALKINKPVFGYRTWDIDGIVDCPTAEEAAFRAVSAAGRQPEPGSRRRC